MSLVDNISLYENSVGKGVKASTVCVHKFGGSSLKDAHAIEQVVTIIEQKCGPADIVVLSAMGKTTDLLIRLVEVYKKQNKQFADEISAIRTYQSSIITDVLVESKASVLLHDLENDIQRIEYLLSYVDDEQFNCADIIGYGELWSTRLVCAALLERNIDNNRVDPRDFIYIREADRGNDIVDWDRSQKLFERCEADFGDSLAVICGYIASDQQGNTITLGRNGSDFTATIVAKLARAKMVYLWTDVNGVYSGDPNVIPDAKAISVLGVHEANAIAKLGTSVFHEKTLKPLKQDQIPVRIGNCKESIEQPDVKGTLILPHEKTLIGAKTVAYKQSVSLFQVKWQATSLCEYLSENLQCLLTQLNISYYCWNEEGGEIKFCVSSDFQTQVAKILARGEAGDSSEFSIDSDVAIISLVGHELLAHGKDLAQYYSTIERSNSQILMHHYDGEGAVSAVIKHDEPIELIRDIHQAIFVSDSLYKTSLCQQLNVVVYGCGNIGRELLSILDRRLAVINTIVSQKIVVIAVCNSSHFVFNENGVELSSVAEDLAKMRNEQKAYGDIVVNSGLDLEELIGSIARGKVCIVDVTASGDVTADYAKHFSKGRHIISAGKLALTLPHEEYENIRAIARDNDCQWLSNVSCGAGLPIQHCLNDLALCGDNIKSIEGVLSGSLSWILSNFNGDKSFSEVVREAKALGLTEPDPRDDLSGKDVQRKLLIIARTLGIKLNLEDIKLSPLIPAKYFEFNEQEFSKCDKEIDLFMKDKWKHAHEQGMKLCYGAEIRFMRRGDELSVLEACVGLSFRDVNDSMVGLGPADNIAVIRSDWHESNPLIIRGPGAGIEVTAAGVVSDLIKLCQ